jgi:hypothetical protein
MKPLPEPPFSFGVSRALPMIRLAREVKVSRLAAAEADMSLVSPGDGVPLIILKMMMD